MLGLGSSLLCQNRLSDGAAAIDDYMWDLITAGELAPLATGAVSDFHDTWDLDGTDYTPQDIATHGDEGYWDLDGTDIRPLDV
tara:strand:- start:1045 stop:1293 length:249 start_codon:yes stop_codon:yes gene_type:complete